MNVNGHIVVSRVPVEIQSTRAGVFAGWPDRSQLGAAGTGCLTISSQWQQSDYLRTRIRMTWSILSLRDTAMLAVPPDQEHSSSFLRRRETSTTEKLGFRLRGNDVAGASKRWMHAGIPVPRQLI